MIDGAPSINNRPTSSSAVGEIQVSIPHSSSAPVSSVVETEASGTDVKSAATTAETNLTKEPVVCSGDVSSCDEDAVIEEELALFYVNLLKFLNLVCAYKAFFHY